MPDTMGCAHIRVPGGFVAIACGPTKRCKCGRRATLACDWKVPSRKSGTCDKPLCDRCTTNPEANGRVNHDKDLCPAHASEWTARHG